MGDVTGQPVEVQDTIQNSEPTRLLIVDDDPITCSGLRHGLELMGCGVELASSGRQAVALLERQPFDAIVLDWSLQGISGLEVMYWARQRCPGLIILILTGSATLDSALEAVRLGANDYLIKPITVQEVVSVVTDALQAQVGNANHSTVHIPPLRLQHQQVVLDGNPDRPHNLTRDQTRGYSAPMEHAGRGSLVPLLGRGRAGQTGRPTSSSKHHSRPHPSFAQGALCANMSDPTRRSRA